MKKLSELQPLDRPREKLKQKGVQALSDVELLAAVLGSGRKGQDVVALSRRLVDEIDARNGDLRLEHLLGVQGVGEAKAAQVLAALEFARRRIHPPHLRVKSPVDVLPLLAQYRNRKQEHFLSVSLNGAHEVLAVRVVSVGLVNRTQVHAREVFAEPLTDRASAIIVAHNHPSGCEAPSRDDIVATERLADAGEILGIPLLDHLIITARTHYSFMERGLMSGC